MSPVNARPLMLPSYGCSFDIIVVPLAVNMPADDVADRDFGAGDLGGREAAHRAHALLQWVHAGMRVGEAAAIGVSGNFPPGAVLCPAMKAPASPRGTKPRSSRP